MRRNVTAIYRTFATADLVRRELDAADISSRHIHVVPDTDQTTGAGERDDHRYMNDLHDLHLPDDDLRTYQTSVRRGDYVVSVNVDDDKVERVQQIMRRPEADSYDLDARDLEFRDEELTAYSDGDRREVNEDWRGRRDTASTDRYVRSYSRDAPLGDRTPR